MTRFNYFSPSKVPVKLDWILPENMEVAFDTQLKSVKCTTNYIFQNAQTLWNLPVLYIIYILEHFIFSFLHENQLVSYVILSLWYGNPSSLKISFLVFCWLLTLNWSFMHSGFNHICTAAILSFNNLFYTLVCQETVFQFVISTWNDKKLEVLSITNFS